MDQFKPPAPLVLTGNLSENWRRWEQRFKLYMTATGADEKDEPVKTAIMLHTVGEDALEVYNTLNVETAGDDEPTLDEIMDAFRSYCTPKKNIVFERHQFWSHSMPEGLAVDKFVTELRQKCKNCEFGVGEEDMIRDKLVFSVPNARMKERLLRETGLTLDKAVDICRAAEAAKSQMRVMGTTQTEASVQALSKMAVGSEKYKLSKKRKQRPPDRAQTFNANACRKCGGTHKPRQCPAYGAVCHKCSKQNHFAKVCTSSQDRLDSVKRVNQLEREVESLFIGTVSCAELGHTAQQADRAWYTTANIRDIAVKFKLDTGADANVLPMNIFKKIPGPNQLKPTPVVLVAYGGARLAPEGTVSFICETTKSKSGLQFFVTKHSSTPILGREACEKLQLVKRVDMIRVKAPATKEELVEAYPSVFSGLGQFPGIHHIHPNVTPVVHGCRKIPIAVMDRLKTTLQELVDKEVIEPVTEPTEWVNSLVITEKKNGSLRVCLDPRDLNEAIKRQHYSIPTPEEVLCRLSGKSIFTILDEKDGYWQVRLDKSSSMLCTFSTPWGRFRFKRLPFGVKSASEVFQQKNCETFGNIDGVHIIADDMIIAAASDEEHDAILQKVMDTAQRANVKFNKEKIQYKVDTVRYMGHVVTSKGVKPDESKVLAIKNMPEPEDRKGLQRLLGMTRYLSQYIPNEATITAPLRQLLRKEAAWHWSHEHRAALNRLKSTLTQAPVLKFYDQSKPLTIQCDASKDGLGACLLQEGSPLSYASRALTESERNYAQIEKELLAIAFATKRFHQYVYGNTVTVQSDHKPLEIIFRKHLSKAPARLQRMLLQLQRYDLNIVYTAGKDMHVADALSRAFLEGYNDEVKEDLFEERVVHAMEATAAMDADTLKTLKHATAADNVLQQVVAMHHNGWPNRRSSIATNLYQYWPMRTAISIRDEILMTGDKIVIPQSARQMMLDRLHLAHQGIQRMKAQARKVMYWPGMTHDIEHMVESCAPCQQLQPQNQKEPLIPHEVPELPWLKIGADIFELHGQSYLIIVDYLSKYPEVLHLPDKTAHTVIRKMKAVFARHGIPKELVSDHVPFASCDMRQFAASWGIKLVHSSPGYPQSNGLAERMVKTVKHALKKATQTGTDPHLALLSLRNTPVTGTEFSPAQVLMGRVLRSTLPIATAVLQPAIPEGFHSKLKHLQARQEHYYNSNSKPLPEFTPGTTVHMTTRRGWEPATVISKRGEPRAYDVQTPSGVTFRRNRQHLRRIHPSLQRDGEYELFQQPEALPTEDSEPPPSPQQDQSAPACEESTGSPSTPIRSTRSGRLIKPPSKYKDFEMS